MQKWNFLILFLVILFDILSVVMLILYVNNPNKIYLELMLMFVPLSCLFDIVAVFIFFIHKPKISNEDLNEYFSTTIN